MTDSEHLKFAMGAVRSVVKSLKENIDERSKVEYKSKFDLYTEMDKKVENQIVDAIQTKYPEHDIVTEETDLEITGSDHVWYLDPISGSTNYAHGLPIYGVSMALRIGEEIKIGVIYNSVVDSLFYAEKNEGAYLEEKKIFVSEVENIDKAIVSTSFPYEKKGRAENLEYFNEIAPKVEGIRRTGSVSVDFSFLALGLIDGFWGVGLKSWDTAAGSLLVEESGGQVSNIYGKTYDISEKDILFSNKEIHDDMLEMFK